MPMANRARVPATCPRRVTRVSGSPDKGRSSRYHNPPATIPTMIGFLTRLSAMVLRVSARLTCPSDRPSSRNARCCNRVPASIIRGR